MYGPKNPATTHDDADLAVGVNAGEQVTDLTLVSSTNTSLDA